MKLGREQALYGTAIALVLLVSSLSLVHISPYREQSDSSQYFRARVTSVKTDHSADLGPIQNVTARLLDGPETQSVVSFTRTNTLGDISYKRLPVGSEVLLSKDVRSGTGYNLVSRWYMPGIATLFTIVLILVVLIGAWRGITGMFGLAISILILTSFVIPRIVAGHNAFATCIAAAILITVVSIFVAHGISKRTAVAFAASLLSLLAVIGLTGLASYVTGTSEVISEENIGVLYAKQPIDLAGLLTGGIIIASLGTLFDITTGQAATVDEIHSANRSQTTGQLFVKGMSVGREHIAALINTLALVYAGVALPSIVTTALYAQNNVYAHIPLVVRLNTETVAEEVIRTCVASIGMLIALPITTWLAAYVLPRWSASVDQRIKQIFGRLLSF